MPRCLKTKISLQLKATQTTHPTQHNSGTYLKSTHAAFTFQVESHWNSPRNSQHATDATLQSILTSKDVPHCSGHVKSSRRKQWISHFSGGLEPHMLLPKTIIEIVQYLTFFRTHFHFFNRRENVPCVCSHNCIFCMNKFSFVFGPYDCEEG